MIPRRIEKKLKQAACQYPVVALTGPRQSGKTTLVRSSFNRYDYVSLENPEEREFCLRDPIGFLNRFRKRVILDEVQRTPEVFSYIQGIVDEDDSAGQFILTGSQNFLLLERITQSLAGRCSILHLLPFFYDELRRRSGIPFEKIGSVLRNKTQNPKDNLFEVMFNGFYPRIHDKKLDPQDWLGNYFQSYLERDLRSVLNMGDLETFGMFVRLCAGRNGCLLNLSSLASDCGISHTTAKRWLSTLEASFLVILLRPHYKNFNKRLIKSPKIYFIDTGLLCFILRIHSPEELQLHSSRGAVFESYVISELIKKSSDLGIEPDLYFWRDSEGHELDVLYDKGDIVPIEIKSGETINSDFFKGIDYWKKQLGNDKCASALIYGGSKTYMSRNTAVYSWYEI